MGQYLNRETFMTVDGLIHPFQDPQIEREGIIYSVPTMYRASDSCPGHFISSFHLLVTTILWNKENYFLFVNWGE